MTTRQCAILVGGLGTRLGNLTKSIPKPLLSIGDKPFLETLLRELARRGFDDIILCAGYCADLVTDFVAKSGIQSKLNIRVRISVEAEPLGTAGALMNAIDHLADEFILLNGDTWFDFNWLDLVQRAHAAGCMAAMALREIENPDRYETVILSGPRVSAFHPRQTSLPSGVINGGVYWLRKEALRELKMPASLEANLLPRLSAAGNLAGWVYDGFFIDIGVPEAYAEAQRSVPARKRRPAVFLDRDGVLNYDNGYIHKSEDFAWVRGAKEAIKALNDRGYYVFVVTNQAGVGHGHYSEYDMRVLHNWVGEQLREMGGHIDDWRFCFYHPEAKLPQFRGSHEWRKPAPGMIKDLLLSWPVDIPKSFLVGDKDIDLLAARGAGVPGYLFEMGNLKNFIEHILDMGVAGTIR